MTSNSPVAAEAAPRQQYRQRERDRELRPADLLLEHRIIFLAGEINYASASDIVMKLLWLQKENRRKDIHFYINSLRAARSTPPSPSTTPSRCSVARWPPTAWARPTAAAPLLLVAGAKGKRFALPHAKVMIHQPQGGTAGQITDIQIQADQYLKARDLIIDVYARHTTQDRAQILKDLDRDFYMTAEEAKKLRNRRRHPHPAEVRRRAGRGRRGRRERRQRRQAGQD